MDKGYIQVYTGGGKGKTTAALGLTLRAAGAGLSVLFLQFMKTAGYSEHISLPRLGNVRMEQYGTGKFIRGNPDADDKEAAQAGWQAARQAVFSGQYDIVVLDEINIAVHWGLVPLSELLELMRTKPAKLELVLTGRHANPQVMELADLVTEMKELKHYYQQGVPAREGIEK